VLRQTNDCVQIYNYVQDLYRVAVKRQLDYIVQIYNHVHEVYTQIGSETTTKIHCTIVQRHSSGTFTKVCLFHRSAKQEHVCIRSPPVFNTDSEGAYFKQYAIVASFRVLVIRGGKQSF
jgi:hypothetical protein